MTTNIVDFAKAKRDAEKKAKKSNSNAEQKKKKQQKGTKNSASEVFFNVYERTIKKWEEFASKNRLSEYIETKIPKFARVGTPSDYVNDLNTLSSIEQKLGMKVVVFSPGTATFNSHGWLAGFHYGENVFSTPPGMVSEANARALNILIWLEFDDSLKQE